MSFLAIHPSAWRYLWNCRLIPHQWSHAVKLRGILWYQIYSCVELVATLLFTRISKTDGWSGIVVMIQRGIFSESDVTYNVLEYYWEKSTLNTHIIILKQAHFYFLIDSICRLSNINMNNNFILQLPNKRTRKSYKSHVHNLRNTSISLDMYKYFCKIYFRLPHARSHKIPITTGWNVTNYVKTCPNDCYNLWGQG